MPRSEQRRNKRDMMPAPFSEAFGLTQTQGELDFVDIPVNADIPLFIDPFAISVRPDRMALACHRAIVAFFDHVVRMIRENHFARARELMAHLREPNETHMGYSIGKPRGAGIGGEQANQLLTALAESSAVKTGFIRSLEEAELLIEGVARDKISDLTTNIIRAYLAEYTKTQCELLGIPISKQALPPFYSPEKQSWISDFHELPSWHGKPILLVPRVFVRYDPAYSQTGYYRHHVLEQLQAEHIDANSSLVHTLKNGKKRVYKRDLEKAFPLTKEFLYRFSRDNPEILDEYRAELEKMEAEGDATPVRPIDERKLAEALSTALASIPAGSDAASSYHNLMIGVVEFLFFPDLLYPQKEKEIHEGRKRIDILMENGARSGIFHRLHDVRALPCAFVPVECKNYSTEVANPELDQLAGRFSTNRGRFGLMLCRHFEDRDRFIERCRDTLSDGRGLIVPLDDETVLRCLGHVMQGSRRRIEETMTQLINEVWVS